ncbi:MAG: BREX system P-loop protein BrxC [Bacilli bacterium]|nr:BREX system P-loop protein BrxC [Bacilli bacterium]
MENLKKLYAKDIEREIQGVIKVDDESYIGQELEEYVVTEELLKHFNSFFSAYNTGINKNTEKMGVWISGFFGSGKYHFLKIVSYLLEKKVFNGKAAVDYFDDKIEDKMLLADIKRAGNIYTDVILFNIDSKTENSNGTKDRILDVFEKVFNEKLGLSITPFVAEIERHIISQGKYEEFKKSFESKANSTWEEMRDGIQFVEDEFANAYAEVLNKSVEEARSIVERTEKNYTLSVEKFAERVRDYIKEKGNNHHVIFLVDEIGQYIGDDRSLMLNLQTIVEDLGLECGGKAWVIVTSQEAIDDVVKVQGNDFSKIQGRFDTKLSLSSSDIDEVIKKRILDKNEESKTSLKMIYDKEESIIRNLLTFKSATYQKVYEDSNDFAETYPFIPYQFKLLQDVFTDIRKHGYAGKHLSSGERSLLGAFQETAKRYGNSEVGTIIPFYAFYDTIEQFLEHQVKIVIKSAIDTVQSGELKEIDIKVLKMLFMLKNIKEIPANIDNLSTLYVSNIKDDKISIKKEIADSLRRLEVQTLIQRNNDEYKFLTDEEQEINREIKQIVIDQNRITDYLKRIVFDYILTDNKFTYKNKNFPLTKYIDNIKYSQEYEIGIKVVTTSPERDDTEIIMQSARENKYVFIKLEISTLIYDEITNYLQVEEYRRSKSGIFQTQQVEDIIRAKQREIEKAEARVKENIREQLNVAEIIIAGDRQNINSNEARTRAYEALEILINNIYTKFAYIKHNFSTQDIKDLFHENRQNMLGNEVEFVNQKAYDAMKEYCEEKNAYSMTMTTRTLLQDFGTAPYGFLDEDILYILTRLLKDEVISLIYNNEVQNITSEDTLTKILKRDYYDRTIIKIRQKIEMSLINDLKSVARNAFNVINLRDDEDGMVEDFKRDCLQSTLNKLNKIAGYYHISNTRYKYPGQDVKDESTSMMERLLRIRDVGDFFKEVSNCKTELVSLAPKIEMVLDFFDGTQKEQFDEARKTLEIYDNNKDFADKTDELNSVVEKITNILTSEEPYSEIHNLPMYRK